MNIKALFRKDAAAAPKGEQMQSPGEKVKRAKRRRKWIILGIVIAVIAGIFFACSLQQAKAMSQIALSETVVLARSDIKSTVGATGTVESADSHTVYSTQNYPVKTLHAEVGDVVTEGDLLCELDASALEDQIESQELATGISAKTAAQQVKTARDSYNASKEALNEGKNASIINAESAVNNAYEAWQKAIRTYDQYTDDDSAALIKAKSEYKIAKENLAAANEALTASPSSLDQIQAQKNAEIAYDAAKDVLEAAYDNEDASAEEYERAIDNAYTAYVTAQQQLEAALFSADTQLQSSKNALASAEINGNTDSAVLKLAQMQEDLEETQVKATASGTVTAVYAKVGASGAGLLFVIEDVNNLIVETSVSGYDVGTVKTGMPVTIKSDATGDTLFNGSVSSIAPTSEKNAQGQTNTAGDVLFDTEVTVKDQNTGLKIGMSVRLNYIVEEQKDVIAVPYDALYEQDGQSYILIASEQQNGKYRLEELPVEKGLENDLNVVITGTGVEEGLRVFSNPTNYRIMIGREITLIDAAGQANAAQGGMRFGPPAAARG